MSRFYDAPSDANAADPLAVSTDPTRGCIISPYVTGNYCSAQRRAISERILAHRAILNELISRQDDLKRRIEALESPSRINGPYPPPET